MQSPKTRGSKRVHEFLNHLLGKIKDLFRLEEVEVTFNHDGKTTGYTYSKTSHHS